MSTLNESPEPRRSSIFSTTPPAITILSDHASHDRGEEFHGGKNFASEADCDRLELHNRLASIFDILRHRNTRCPLAVAIYGDWGSGKTSAMRWLESRLNEWNRVDVKDRKNHPRVYPVWFDPWRYQTSEEVWRGIIAEVILALFSIEHMDRQNLVPRLVQAAKKFGGFLGKSFLHGLAHIELKAGGGVIPGEVSVSGEAFRDIWEEYGKASQPHAAYLNQFEATLRQWVNDFLAGPPEGKEDSPSLLKEPARLCIFIDDLDRCLPEVTLQVIEALKLYLNIDNLIFVVGLDDSVVRSIITKHYDKNGVAAVKALSYLDKIFQVEQRITVSSRRMPRYMEQQIQVLDQATNGYWTAMLKPTGYKETLEDALVHLAGNNPRTCKRLLNSAFLLGQAASLDESLTPDTDAPRIEVFKGDPKKWRAAMQRWQDKMKFLRFAQGIQVYAIQTWFRQRFENARDLIDEPKTLAWLEVASVGVRDILKNEAINMAILRNLFLCWARLRSTYPDYDFLQDASQSLDAAKEIYATTYSTSSNAVIPAEVWELSLFVFDQILKDAPHPDETFWSDAFFLNVMSVPFSRSIAEHFPPVRKASGSGGETNPSLADLPTPIRERLSSIANVPLDELRAESLRDLKEVNLLGLPLTSAQLHAVLRTCAPSILRLDGCTGLSDTAALKGLRQLERLVLSGCTGLHGVGAFKGLSGLENLRRLNLSSCTGLQDTEDIAELRQLEVLDLCRCTGLNEAVKLKGLAGLGNLRRLFLVGCTGLDEEAVREVRGFVRAECEIIGPDGGRV